MGIFSFKKLILTLSRGKRTIRWMSKIKPISGKRLLPKLSKAVLRAAAREAADIVLGRAAEGKRRKLRGTVCPADSTVDYLLGGEPTLADKQKILTRRAAAGYLNGRYRQRLTTAQFRAMFALTYDELPMSPSVRTRINRALSSRRYR